ncbi:glycoside hydrolase family 3 protein [Vibrio splendidus]|nr:glycoside hydrolase family 3 protein [Vibrio splendidus]
MLRFFIISLALWSCKSLATTLTPLADEYLEQHGVEKSVAQILVTGVTADFNNLSYSTSTKELLSLNVGGVILNAYNVPEVTLAKSNNRNHGMQIVKEFTETIRRMHNDGSNLLIAADFESYRYTSVRYPLIPPPSALTISANNSTQAAYSVGDDVGKQLESVGINVLLGPVLDEDSKVQGTRNTNIMNRSFGGNGKIISVFASEFIRGINNNRVAAFAKHFPGYGFVSSNPHSSDKVDINATNRAIIKGLTPFSDTSSLLAGVMTSHLHINKSNRPLTVSKANLDLLMSNEVLKPLSKKIIITDDISGMDSIQSYKSEEGIDNSMLVLNSFKSGHDLILISHLNQHSKNEFTVDDVKDSIGLLTKYAQTDDGLNRLKTSLEKILTVKNSVSVKRKDNKSFSEHDIDNIKKRNLDIYKNSTINISSSDILYQSNFMDFASPNKKIYIIGESKYFSEILNNIPKSKSVVYKDIKSLTKNKHKGAKLINKIGFDLSKLVEDGNYLVFLVSSLDSYNILDSLRLHNTEPSRVLVSVHGSPLPINTATLLNYKVVTNFDYSPSSSYPIGLILNGDLIAGDVRKSPIELGNGAIFQLADRLEIEHHGNDSELTKKIIKEKNHKFSLNLWLFLLPVTLVFASKIMSMSIFSCHAKKSIQTNSRREFWKEAIVSKSYLFRKILIIFFLILGFVAVPIFVSSPGQFSEIVSSSDNQIKTKTIENLVDALLFVDGLLARL